MLPNLNEINALNTHILTLPSGKTIKIRKWKMRDKKEYLLKVDKNSPKEDLNKIIENIVASCIMDDTKFQDLNTPDFIYLFIELRKLSEGDTFEFAFECGSCKELNENVNLDLSSALHIYSKTTKDLTLSNGLTFSFKDIPYVKEKLLEVTYKENTVDLNIAIIAASIKSVYFKNTPYNNFTEEELKVLIEDLDVNNFKELFDYLVKNMSSTDLYFSTACKKCGKVNNIALEGLENFF